MAQPTRPEPGGAQGASDPLSALPNSLIGPDRAQCSRQSPVALAQVCHFSVKWPRVRERFSDVTPEAQMTREKGHPELH